MEHEINIREACKERYQPVVDRINRLLQQDDEILLVAIDGNAAAGKTTLGFYLKSIFSCNLFHMDDFFLQNEQRTPERLAQVGGNVDYRRFKKEVLESILQKETVCYQPFSCKEGKLQQMHQIPFKRLNIIEGSYSQHPYFGDVYQLRVFVKIPREVQIERIRIRNGETMLERFRKEWIPKEDAFFEMYGIDKQSMIID